MHRYVLSINVTDIREKAPTKKAAVPSPDVFTMGSKTNCVDVPSSNKLTRGNTTTCDDDIREKAPTTKAAVPSPDVLTKGSKTTCVDDQTERARKRSHTDETPVKSSIPPQAKKLKRDSREKKIDSPGFVSWRDSGHSMLIAVPKYVFVNYVTLREGELSNSNHLLVSSVFPTDL
ncbi:hypothetical protein J6590_065258 [Homalodisca vitripennis]|nr:hypothetical protein J6590_065258 [Homalodisca vitripennis]